MSERGGGAGRSRHEARLVTVAFVRHEDEVLLLRHGSGSDRFVGLWNGIGGHVESGEDIRAAARRELWEEAGVHAPDLQLRAVVHESGLVGHAHVVFVFGGRVVDRVLRPADGLEVAWHPIGAVETLPRVHDVDLLLRHALDAGDPIFLTASYDGDRRTGLVVDDPSRCARGVET